MNIEKVPGFSNIDFSKMSAQVAVNNSQKAEKPKSVESSKRFPQAHVTIGIPILHLSGETETETTTTTTTDEDGNIHTETETKEETTRKKFDKLMAGVPIEGTPLIMGLDGDYIGVQIGNAATTIQGPAGKTKIESNLLHWGRAWKGIVEIEGAY